MRRQALAIVVAGLIGGSCGASEDDAVLPDRPRTGPDALAALVELIASPGPRCPAIAPDARAEPLGELLVLLNVIPPSDPCPAAAPPES